MWEAYRVSSFMTSLSFETSPLVAACSCGVGYTARPVRRVNRPEMVAVDIPKWANLLTYKMETTIPHYLYACLSHLTLCMPIAQ